MAESIVRDGETGRAIVDSTGTPVEDILSAIESTGTVQGALRLHPGLTPEAVGAALRFARVAVRREVRYAPDPNFGNTQVREVSLSPYRSGSGSGSGSVTIDAGEYESTRARLGYLEASLGAGEAGFEADTEPRSLQASIQAADDQCDQLRYELDLVASIRDGLQEIADGKGMPHDEVFAHLTGRYPR